MCPGPCGTQPTLTRQWIVCSHPAPGTPAPHGACTSPCRPYVAAGRAWGWPQDAPSMTVSRGPRVGALGARAGPECGFTVAHGVSAVRHKPPESGDALAGRAPRAPVDPTSPWKASGVRVGAAGGSRSVLEAGVVSVVSLVVVNFWARRLRTVVAAGRVGWVWLLEKSTTARRGPRNGTVCRIWSERSPPCGCQCAREGGDRHLLDTARRFAVGV